MNKPLGQVTFDLFGQQQEEGTKDLLPQQNNLPPQSQKPKPSRGRKALKDFEADAEQVEIPDDDVLFQKQYYSIGEVAGMYKVNTSLIRY